MSDLQLLETVHPDKAAQVAFNALISIDEHKGLLVDELVALLDQQRLAKWERKHHPAGIGLARRWTQSAPLVLLSGEVGCGKTALANAVGTPLAHALDRKVVVLETPSDLRGWGHVGELSARITDAFMHARRRAKEVGAGILVVDEADDVATARTQMQAHHEDRAGLNVFIKQIDQLSRSKAPLVVVMITNRDSVLDPAVRRRASLHLKFTRPGAAARRAIFAHLLDGVRTTDERIQVLVAASERKGVPYSTSDLVDRLARAVLREAQRNDVPVSIELFLACLDKLDPSPLMRNHKPEA